MTTTRINHTGHGHDNTAAARAACRKAIAATPRNLPVNEVPAASAFDEACAAYRRVLAFNGSTSRNARAAARHSMTVTRVLADELNITAVEANSMVSRHVIGD